MLTAWRKEEQNIAKKARLAEKQDRDRQREQNKQRDLEELRLQGRLEDELLCHREMEEITDPVDWLR